MSKAHTRSLVTALITAIALIAVSVLYAHHEVGRPAHEQGHCDLCSHLSGTAGSPAQVVVAGRPVRAMRALPAGNDIILSSRPNAGIRLPRGPPHSLEPV